MEGTPNTNTLHAALGTGNEILHQQRSAPPRFKGGIVELLGVGRAPEFSCFRSITEYLGGPETEGQLIERHRSYLGPDANGNMFRVVLLPEGQVVGLTGFWDREWNGESAYETGYAILPEFQGRGLAVAAALAAAGKAKADGRYRLLYAFPSIHHLASNAVCRKAGFEFVEECDFEYPKGHFLPSNVWRMDLSAADER